jgi:DNA repair protein RadC
VKYAIPQYRCRLVRDGAAIDAAPYAVNAERAAEICFELLKDLPVEEVHVLYLNGRSQVIGTERVSVGGLHGCAISAREVFRGAILANAIAIILAHNHPSGDPTPSSDDILMTKGAQEAGYLLGIPLIDHIVVCPETRKFSSVMELL